MTGARKSLRLAQGIANNRTAQVTAAVLLAGTFITPLFTPFLTGAAYALAVSMAAVAFGYPAAKLAGAGLRKLTGISLSGSQSSGGKGNSERDKARNVSNGKATGNELVDSLTDKLRKSGLKVTTDWKEAEKVLKNLPEKYDHLKKEGDNLRGFVYQGVIFLNPNTADASVPIHEYTHVWAEALRQNNPAEWQHIVELLKKETAIWEEVKAGYPHLTKDDEIADEVLATYSGRHGQQKLAEYYKDGVKPKTAFEELRKALEEFWKEVSKFFKCHFDTVEDVADRALYDMLRGVNPDKYIDENKLTLSDEGPQASKKYSGKRYQAEKPKENQVSEESEEEKSSSPLRDTAVAKFAELLISRMEEMEKSDWKKGWVSDSSAAGLPQNIHSGVLNGTNRFVLQLHTAMNGYTMPLYMTFKQATALGVHVKKGEESIPVVYWGFRHFDATGKYVKPEVYENMTEEERAGIVTIPFLKGYYEFNVDQTNLKEVHPEMYAKLLERFKVPEAKDAEGMYVNEAFDRLLEQQAWVCPIHYDKQSHSAFYRPSTDDITVPMKSQFKISDTPEEVFKDGMEWYSTIAHEMGHSTGSPERLNRVKGDRFGDKAYGYEECVAEMTAAVVGKTLGFDSRIEKNNTHYVRGWISNIKEKPDVVLGMLGDIGKASNMILEKINEQKIALGETPILDKGTILNEDDKDELKKVSVVKGIVGFLVKLAGDPSPHASLTRQQHYVLCKHLDMFPTKEERQQEADRIWGLAQKDPGMKKAGWPESAKEALQRVVDGVKEEQQHSSGIHR